MRGGRWVLWNRLSSTLQSSSMNGIRGELATRLAVRSVLCLVRRLSHGVEHPPDEFKRERDNCPEVGRVTVDTIRPKRPLRYEEILDNFIERVQARLAASPSLEDVVALKPSGWEMNSSETTIWGTKQPFPSSTRTNLGPENSDILSSSSIHGDDALLRSQLSSEDSSGKSVVVNVSEKVYSKRVAVASSKVGSHLSRVGGSGEAAMVNVSEKAQRKRVTVASGRAGSHLSHVSSGKVATINVSEKAKHKRVTVASGQVGSHLTHVDSSGEAAMVNVSKKADSKRVAVASGRVVLGPHAFSLVAANNIAKGDVLTVAKISGIYGAKQTGNLIPLCHNILLSGVDVSLMLNESLHSVEIVATVTSVGPTGVEMEALTAVSVASLTVYDMCKAVSKEINICDIRLESKTGGKSGDWNRRSI